MAASLVIPTGNLSGQAPLNDRQGMAPIDILRLPGKPPGKLSTPLWALYLADAIQTSEGAQPATWPDLGPNGYDLTLTHGTSGPTWTRRSWQGRPSVYFTGQAGNFYRDATAGHVVPANATTWMVVIEPDTSIDQAAYFGAWNGTNLPANFYGSFGQTYGQGLIVWNGNASFASSPSAYNLMSPGPQIVTFRSDGANIHFRINGVEVGTGGTSVWAPAGNLFNFTLGQDYIGTSPYQGRMHAALIWNGYLSDADVAAAETWVGGYFGSPFFNVDTEKDLIVFDGNSLFSGIGAPRQQDTVTELLMDRIGRGHFQYLNFSLPYAASGFLNTRAATLIDPLQSKRRRRNLLIYIEGINSTVAADIATYCAARTAAGWEVIVFTPPSFTGKDAAIASQNTTVRGAWPTYAVECADLGADPRMGVLSAVSGNNANTAYFKSGDNGHWAPAGQAIAADHGYAAYLNYRNTQRPPTALGNLGSGAIQSPIHLPVEWPALTQDATAFATRTIQLPNNGEFLISISGAGARVNTGASAYSTTGNGVVFNHHYAVKTVAGVATVTSLDGTGGFGGGVAYPAASTLSTANAALVASGQNVVIQLTGEAAANIAWKVSVDRFVNLTS